jgi:hypothetical protein
LDRASRTLYLVSCVHELFTCRAAADGENDHYQKNRLHCLNSRERWLVLIEENQVWRLVRRVIPRDFLLFVQASFIAADTTVRKTRARAPLEASCTRTRHDAADFSGEVFYFCADVFLHQVSHQRCSLERGSTSQRTWSCRTSR